MVTPTPRSALITRKAFAAGLRSVIQAAVVVVLSAILGVSLTNNPLKLIATAVVVVLGSAFFSCLSMTIAGLALRRDRLMGIGQAITMPLFFSSSADDGARGLRRPSGSQAWLGRGGAACSATRGRGHRVASGPGTDGGTARRGAAACRHDTSTVIRTQVITSGDASPGRTRSLRLEPAAATG